jgi:AraC-like DNA-binding protein
MSRPEDPGKAATTIGGYALAIAKALDYSGVDSARIFRAADVPTSLTNDPMQRLSVDAMKRLYRVSVDATNNPYFGLTVARFIHISNLHAMGHGLAASATLLDFCHRLDRYFRMVSEAATSSLTDHDGEVILSFEHVTELSGETEDALVGFLVIAMRQLSEAGFNPLRVELRHAEPLAGAAPYETLFRAPVVFDQTHTVLAFRKADLLQPLAGSCAELAQVNDNIATKYIALLDKDDVVSRVKQKVIELLPNGECTREIVATAMNMSPTALQFKLSKRDTSFHDVMDNARQEMARSYVQQSALSVTEIAYLLGFNDTSNFARAFKRWTGKSPTEFREGADHASPALAS